MNKLYKPLRDNVIVEYLSQKVTEAGIYMPDDHSAKWARLKVLAIGPNVTEKLTPGMIVLAEDMTEKMAGTEQRVILSKYIHVIEGQDARYESQ